MTERGIVPIINSGRLCLNIEDGTVTFNGKLVFLSPYETDLFAVLLLSKEIVSNKEIVKRTVGPNLPGEIQIKNEKRVGPLMHSLQRKLRKVGEENSIENLRGHGYRWVGEQD
jgi:DNA-binding response OmpR family regulator